MTHAPTGTPEPARPQAVAQQRSDADLADRMITERDAWQRTVSDALGLTVEDHGTQYASLDRCVTEIRSLLDQRHQGWSAAYERGRQDERDGVDAPDGVSCTCGYGGFHEPENPRCERNQS